MNLILEKKEYRYEIENICRVFIPDIKINYESPAPSDDCIIFKYEEKSVKCSVKLNGNCFSHSEEYSSDEELASAICLYKIFSEYFGFIPKWGVLTGVRPAKLFSSLSESDGLEYAIYWFKEKLLVSDEKIKLCEYAVSAEKKALKYDSPDSFSLYVSIPFCPSRCSYCSFVSHSIEKAGKLIPDYVDLLCNEIEYTANIANELGLKLKTVYFGGGTPTILSAEQLNKIMTAINNSFDLSELCEYTIEAGRPDTLTSEKLSVMRSLGCNRISINPQTMQDKILENIGRKHSVEQVKQAFELARKADFDNINMDLIAGLPGDNYEGFAKSLDRILSDEFNPENVTVHTLSLKRSSRLVTDNKASGSSESKMVEQMLEYSANRLFEKGYVPYYLYRQSKMLGNFENVGWSKSGFDCLYNIYMMNEIHTVFSVGAGGVTRLKDPYGKHIERIFNYKFPYEYNARFEEILNRKRFIGDFYGSYPTTPKVSVE